MMSAFHAWHARDFVSYLSGPRSRPGFISLFLKLGSQISTAT